MHFYELFFPQNLPVSCTPVHQYTVFWHSSSRSQVRQPVSHSHTPLKIYSQSSCMASWDKNCQYFIDTSAIIDSANLFNSSQIPLSMPVDFFCVVIICLHSFFCVDNITHETPDL